MQLTVVVGPFDDEIGCMVSKPSRTGCVVLSLECPKASTYPERTQPTILTRAASRSFVDVRFTSGNPTAALPAPATTFGGMESAQAAAQAAVAALGVSLPRPTTTLRLNNMLTPADLQDESSFGDIEEETKVSLVVAVGRRGRRAKAFGRVGGWRGRPVTVRHDVIGASRISVCLGKHIILVGRYGTW